MQAELASEGLPMEIQILGINEAGQEAGNDNICRGRDIPWLQDTMDEHVWQTWQINYHRQYRDVFILDGENVIVGEPYNLTVHNLADSAAREELKARLRQAAGAQ